MAILRPGAHLIVDSIPLHTPVDNEATLARLENTSTFYYWDGASWITLVLTQVSDLAYDAGAWDGVVDVAPSQNAVRDAIQALVVGTVPDADYGDITVSAVGTVWTIDADSVTFAKMQNIATDRLLGRDTAASGDVEELTVGGGIEFTGSAGIQTSAFTGDVTKAAGGTVTTIANDAVPFAKQGNIPTDSLVGRDTAGTGDPESITVDSTLEFTGAQVLRRAAISNDVVIAAGANTATIPNDTITYAKMQNVSATDRLLGRVSGGAGDVEEIVFTDFAQSILDDVDEATFKATVNLEIGTDVQAFDAGLDALAAFNTNGLVVQTADNTFAGRTLTGTANEITVTNGDGVAGAPTLSLPTVIDLGGKTSLEIPNSAAPALTVTGQIAVDSTVADVSHGVLKYYGGEELTTIAVPIAELTGMVDGDTIVYNATTDEFQVKQLPGTSTTGALPIAVYRAILSQAAVSVPTESIITNTLGEVPSIIRNDVGDYEVNTVATIFTANKVFVTATIGLGATAAIVRAGRISDTEIGFVTTDAADSPVDLTGTLTILIEVYA